MPHWIVVLQSLVELAGAVVIGLIADFILFRILIVANHHTRRNLWVPHLRSPMRYGLVLIAVKIALPWMHLSIGWHHGVDQLLSLSLIAMVGWALVNLTFFFEGAIFEHYHISPDDTSLNARKLRTRVSVLSKIAVAVIVIITLSTMLMTFPAVRTLGASLLASAGIIGLVSGLAARPVLTNLIAGLQLALTQPIRIEDVVIVDGEWGWIEEIDVTFVVVRIWDLRRLILPLSYFIEQPFQNWTYKGADLLGYVHLYTDYAVDVETVRAQLHAILQQTPLWDKATWSLQVTGTDEHGVQLRALFGTRDSNDRWNLMVLVREKLLAFIQKEYPEYLPRTRMVFPGIQGTPQTRSEHGAERAETEGSG